MEGRRDGREGRAVGREEKEEREGSEQYSSGPPSKNFNPNGETGFLCVERQREIGEWMKGEREKGKDIGEKRQRESVKREKFGL